MDRPWMGALGAELARRGVLTDGQVHTRAGGAWISQAPAPQGPERRIPARSAPAPTSLARRCGLQPCACGGWFNPADPAEWSRHKNCG
ncbi:hypothetical protein [Nocardiopsis halophila]|uniref:hypothetical protein n=1 Tax=Nocardiopsis halophila TaxID=141692 RepID=UPI000369343D|nr:hypothetical protein [Nocardiopsis halophila]